MNNIIFYAPVGTNVPIHMLGGGEKGCRRTREILTEAGYNVITVDKPIMGMGLKKYIFMAIKAYKNWCVSLFSNKDAIAYVVGFYEKNVYIEWLFFMTARLSGHKTIYEARNGRLIKAYDEYGTLYKFFANSILKKADKVFAQGLEYVHYIQDKFGKAAIYTPNYVMNRNLKDYNEKRTFDVIRLVYFGRVSETKNIDIVIKVAAELNRQGYICETAIIGGYEEEYKKKLDMLILHEGLDVSNVQFYGAQNFEVISNVLQESHFFVFPSKEKMEGHSNSLTEAMTFGVVPVVSTAGFNESIVGIQDLVVRTDDVAVKYVQIIVKILKENKWEFYSKYVYNRIKENYTEDIVKGRIIKAIGEF